MRILVTNDDGIESEGLHILAETLAKKHEVTVVAPNGNRSASSHSLTIHSELVFERRKISDNFESFTLSGTPADCVKFAVHFFNEERFDLVCSGINWGDNLGSNTSYSGTVSAALEGNYFHIPSISFSNISHTDCKFQDDADIIEQMLPKLLKIVSGEYTLNVNFPNIPKEEIKGVKLTPLGFLGYDDFYRQNENGSFSLMGDPIFGDNGGENDIILCNRGYVTVTPILFNRTAYSVIEKFSELF